MFRIADTGHPDAMTGALEQDRTSRWSDGPIDPRAVESILSPSKGWSLAANRIPGLQSRCLPLPVEYVDFALRRVELVQNVDKLFKCADWRVESCDVSSMSVAETRALLAARGSPKHECVAVLRPIDSAGLSIRYVDFVQHYERFWWPWGDDLVIAGLDFTWLLEMNHEELLTFRQLS